MQYWLVSNSLKWNIQALAKYITINLSGIGGSNINKLTDYELIANTLILKVK